MSKHDDRPLSDITADQLIVWLIGKFHNARLDRVDVWIDEHNHHIIAVDRITGKGYSIPAGGISYRPDPPEKTSQDEEE